MQQQLGELVLSSRIRLARNFAKLPFPAELKDNRAFESVQKLVFNAINENNNFKIFPTNLMSFETLQTYFEKHLISKNICLDPSFSALIINQKNNLSILVNEEDHIREQCILQGFCLEEAKIKLDKIDVLLQTKLELAFDNKIGFLTSSIFNCGTGMRASCLIFLPATTFLKKIDEVKTMAKKYNMIFRGAYGEGSLNEGCLYQISNATSLGETAVGIIKNVNDFVKIICKYEFDLQQKLLQENFDKTKNFCFQAIGLLSSSYSLTKSEFSDLIARAKLGYLLKFYQPKYKDFFDNLFDLAQPYTLMGLANQKLSEAEFDKFRAKYLRTIFKDSIII